MLRYLHRRFQTHPEHKSEYIEFLRDYEKQGHMREVELCYDSRVQCVYIPHHPVLRDKSVTTHLRVVFNASSLTVNGTSLNEHLLIGPKLQQDLSAVTLQWRQYKYVYSADIKQMYRQILIDPRDANYQRIMWNYNPDDIPREYQLLTVTYGMASAPYLALRVLKQLAEDEGDNYPMAVSILRDKIYVDDVLFGHDDKTALQQTRDQLQHLLKRGGFNLHKWSSNSPDLLTDIADFNANPDYNKLIQSDERLNILGLSWSPSLDSFQFEVAWLPTLPATKRAILSAIAKLFDPLGWVTPVTVKAKIFMQHLWRSGLGWDEQVPPDMYNKWKLIYSSFSALSGLQITRWTGQGAHVENTEIHGFADASSVAFAAAVYLKVIDRSGHVRITLLAGKSKVAPVATVSIPRLELSAAVLLSRLINFVQSNLPGNHSYFCWTDSTVVLAWLKQHPSEWKPYVANRVAEIQNRLPNLTWRHVATHDNPADCASRGLLGNELKPHTLWWQGPLWLLQSEDQWSSPPTAGIDPDVNSEMRKITSHTSQSRICWDLASKFSSWNKLIRITAYIFRFINKCRRNTSVALVHAIALSADEVQVARIFWYKQIQRELFSDELRALTEKTAISPRSTLLSLHPFVDQYHSGG